MELVLEIIEQD